MIKLNVDNLYLSYGSNDILKGVSLQLSQGEVVSLLGPSGSGKTTLLRAVAGLEQPAQGSIEIAGQPVFNAQTGIELPAEKRNLGLVFQSYALWPHKTVFDNVAYGLKLRKVSQDATAEKVHSALTQLGLAHLDKRFPHQLSGGQQQRVAIARALVYNPPVILLDEPLSNLDAKMREEARAWLRELIVELHLSALVVTHDQDEAMAMSDRILLLSEGRIEQQGTPQEMYAKPQTLFCAEFMGNNNRLSGQVSEQRSSAHGRQLCLKGTDWALWGTDCKNHRENVSDANSQSDIAADKQDAIGMIRLERVRLVDSGGENRLRLPLVTSMFLGNRWEHIFHRDGLRLRAYGQEALPSGEHWLEIPANDFWVFPAN